MTLTIQNLKYISRLINETLKVPAAFLNDHDDILFTYKPFYLINPFYDNNSLKELTDTVFHDNAFSDIPMLKSTSHLENYLAFRVQPDDARSGMLLIGPVLFTEISEKQMTSIVKDFSISREKQKINRYYQSVPVVSKMEFLNHGKLIYYLLYKKPLDIVEILQQTIVLDTTKLEVDKAEINLSVRRQNQSFHHDRLYEEEIFQCIKEGRKEQVIEKFSTPPPQGEFGILSKTSYLRDKKNLAISAITIATRKAMDGGLDTELAYTLSDLFIQTVEEMQDVKKVNSFMIESLAEFADRVKTSKQKKYSRAINTCLSYIFKHLYEDIRLTSLAETVEMNPSYLSALFKKEVGMSLSKYIQQEKIEEAKKLLLLTNHSLSEICTLLDFTDQSYFTKVFKRIAGVTPKQFRSHSMLGRPEGEGQ